MPAVGRPWPSDDDDDDDDDDDGDDDHLLRLDAFLHLLKEVCPRQSNHGRRLMPTFQYQNIIFFF